MVGTNGSTAIIIEVKNECELASLDQLYSGEVLDLHFLIKIISNKKRRSIVARF